MKGVILAGGLGTRLRPATKAISKQLIPVYDKPMIFYPLTTLILAGIREVAVVCNPGHVEDFEQTLGDGSEFQISIKYLVQTKPLGIAHCLIIAKDFLAGQKCCLILGDNIFHGPGLGRKLQENLGIDGAKIFAYEVSNPSEYGVVDFDSIGNVTSIEEKPKSPKSSFAIPGLYFFDQNCSDFAKLLTPSLRGELEITDVLKKYKDIGKLKVERLPLGSAWLDTGTFEAIHDASSFVRTLQARQGIVIGDPKQASRMAQ
jgi:glucose-1-phosphate thymidylyltransferase